MDEITGELNRFAQVQLDWVMDRAAMNEFAKVVAKSDRCRVEYDPFDAEIVWQLRFTVSEAEATRDGLDVKIMELPPGGAAMIRALRSWRRMQWINRLGPGTAP